VGGPTGSGKSTTLAAIVDRINRDSTRHIISLEDPIEFVYPRRQGLVNQREVGTHLHSTAAALRSMLRQDPDVLVVGEMRDLPTISFAVAAAETGHLVFGTVHTASADSTIDRIVNAFPAAAREQTRSMLAGSLKAVVCQHLIPRRDGTGRVLAAEVLINNDAVSNLIRKGKAYQIQSVVATAREQGMQSMDVELRRLVREGLITAEEAYMRAASKKDFEKGDPAAADAPAPVPLRGAQRA
jgi:twitching motility protein PilT